MKRDNGNNRVLLAAGSKLAYESLPWMAKMLSGLTMDVVDSYEEMQKRLVEGDYRCLVADPVFLDGTALNGSTPAFMKCQVENGLGLVVISSKSEEDLGRMGLERDVHYSGYVPHLGSYDMEHLCREVCTAIGAQPGGKLGFE